MNIEAVALLILVHDHVSDQFRNEISVHEPIVDGRHIFGHILFRVAFAFIHRIFDRLRPLVVPMKALVQKARLFPLGLRLCRFVVVERNPEIVIALSRTTAVFTRAWFIRVIENLVQ